MENTKFDEALSKFIGKKCGLIKPSYNENVVKVNDYYEGVLHGLNSFNGLLFDMGSLGVLKTTTIVRVKEVSKRIVNVYTMNSIYQLNLLGSDNQECVEKVLKKPFNKEEEGLSSTVVVIQGNMANVVSKSMGI